MLWPRISRSTKSHRLIPSSSLVHLIVMLPLLPVLMPAASIVPLTIPVSTSIATSPVVSVSCLVSHLSRIVRDHAARLDRAHFLREFI